MNDINAAPAVNTSTAKLVYILYLVGLVFGITGIIGVIVAYVNKGDGPDWLQSHYRFQIRTFWMGLVFFIVGGILLFVLVGWLVYLFWVVWLIIRCVKGLKALEQQQSLQDEKTWLF
uniref:Probable transmembrane protein n=1 Tax=Rheinheimera sp. BAL341 TaxID=1708203 RepID=A0A486XVY1_9GAMM